VEEGAEFEARSTGERAVLSPLINPFIGKENKEHLRHRVGVFSSLDLGT
jgi:hypothetical protein